MKSIENIGRKIADQANADGHHQFIKTVSNCRDKIIAVLFFHFKKLSRTSFFEDSTLPEIFQTFEILDLNFFRHRTFFRRHLLEKQKFLKSLSAKSFKQSPFHFVNYGKKTLN